MRGGQDDDERGEHARRLLGVAVAHEEPALAIEQQLVEPGRDRPSDAEAVRGARHDAVERPRPVPPADPHLAGADLPATAHGRVHDRVLPAAEGRRLGRAGQLPGLHGQQRQGYGSDPLHLQRRRQQLGRA